MFAGDSVDRIHGDERAADCWRRFTPAIMTGYFGSPIDIVIGVAVMTFFAP